MLLAISGCYSGADGGRGAGTDGVGEGGTGDDDDDDDDDDADETGGDDGEALGLGGTGLRLLTPAQYANSVIAVLGDVAVEPVGQWRSSIAAAQGGVSPAGVEDYEVASHDVATQVFADPVARAELAGCEPVHAPGDACVQSVLETLGLRAWRRPMTAEELERYVQLAYDTGALLGNDPWVGLQHAVAGLLMSPNFLYRVELGHPDDEDDTRLELDGFEVASRLAYLVWNRPPDDELLDAAIAGELDDPEGLAVQVERMLADERATAGTVQVFVDAFDLDALLSLQKDPELLPAYSQTLGPAMRAELVEVITDTILIQRDYRRLFDTQTGYVDTELAALYGVPGTFGAEPTAVELPDTRGGLLTLAGFLAINSGEASTSPTSRGLTVRRALMCQTVPPPPPDVEAELPEPEGGGHQTKREQLEQHAVDPACVSCHEMTDPIGLALEHFDAIGGYRATDQGLTIDPSGELDGTPFDDAIGLGTALSEHPAVMQCGVRNLYRYAMGHVEQPEEAPTVDLVMQAFEDDDYDLRSAIEALATADAFRYATLPDQGEGGQ